MRHPARVDRLVLSAAIRIGRSDRRHQPGGRGQTGRLRADPAANAPRIARYFYTEDFLAAHPGSPRRFSGGRRAPVQRARRNALIPGAPGLDLCAITAPTLVLAQAEDRLVPPAHSLAIAREIPGARTVVVEGLGRVGTIPAPAPVGAALTLPAGRLSMRRRALLAARPRAAFAHAEAEGFPARPLRLLVPFAPGGPLDHHGRPLAGNVADPRPAGGVREPARRQRLHPGSGRPAPSPTAIRC